MGLRLGAEIGLHPLVEVCENGDGAYGRATDGHLYGPLPVDPCLPSPLDLISGDKDRRVVTQDRPDQKVESLGLMRTVTHLLKRTAPIRICILQMQHADAGCSVCFVSSGPPDWSVAG